MPVVYICLKTKKPKKAKKFANSVNAGEQTQAYRNVQYLVDPASNTLGVRAPKRRLTHHQFFNAVFLSSAHGLSAASYVIRSDCSAPSK